MKRPMVETTGFSRVAIYNQTPTVARSLASLTEVVATARVMICALIRYAVVAPAAMIGTNYSGKAGSEHSGATRCSG